MISSYSVAPSRLTLSAHSTNCRGRSRERVSRSPHTPCRGRARGGTGRLLPRPGGGGRLDELLLVSGSTEPRRRPRVGASDGAPVHDEGLSDDRGRLDDQALIGRESVEPRGEEGLDRRRDREVLELATLRASAPTRRESALRPRASTASARRIVGFPGRHSTIRARSESRARYRRGGARPLRSSPPPSAERARHASSPARSTTRAALDELLPGRAHHRIGTRRPESRDARSARNVASAQWMSSNSTRSGRGPASSSSRAPQFSSAAGNDAGESPIAAATLFDVDVSPRAASFPRASSIVSRSRIPHAWRTASASGQYVIPSAVGEAASAEERGPSPTDRTNSSMRRDLPTPASPITVTRSALSQLDRLGERAPELLELALAAHHGCVETDVSPESPRTSIRRYARTGSDFPLSSSGSTSSTSTKSRTSRYVRSPSRTSCAPAACSRRAATFTASPVTRRCPAVGSPATTCPVLTPVRTVSRTPQWRSSSSFSTPAPAASRPPPARHATRRPRAASGARRRP